MSRKSFNDQLAAAWGHAPKQNKYSAKKNTKSFPGMSFDSGGEAEMYGLLLMQEKAGKIKDIRRQVSLDLTPSCKFKIDFVVFDIDRGIDIGIEYKGFVGERWRIIKQLWSDLGPMPIQVWGKAGKRLFMQKEIKGK